MTKKVTISAYEFLKKFPDERAARLHTMDRIDALIGKTLGVRLTYANLTGEFA